MVDNKWIFANQWGSNDIYQINKTDGAVHKVWNFEELETLERKETQTNDPANDVLNGISYRESS